MKRFLPAACALAVLAVGLRPSRLNRPWEKDEPIRVGETVFWRLLRAGDLHNPRWRDPMDASHPVMMKLVYGSLLEATGHDLPRDFAMLDALLGGADPNQIPPELRSTFDPLHRPARIISVVINSLGAGAASWLAMDLAGTVAPVALTLMMLGSWVFESTLATAVSDPLEMLSIVAAGVMCRLWWKSGERSRSDFLLGAGGGIFAASAFLTRFDGLLALGSIFCVAAAGWRHFSQTRSTRFATAAAGAFAAISIAFTPIYWPPPGSGAAALVRLPASVIGGMRIQAASLAWQLSWSGPEWRLLSLAARLRFVAKVLFSGKAGILCAVGIVLLILPAVRRSLAPEQLLFSAVWAPPILVVFTAWLPVAWPRYVHHVLPEAALVSSLGWAGALAAARRRFRAGSGAGA